MTDYDVSSQELVKLTENIWRLPYLEGTYKYEGTDMVTMEDRLKLEEADENGMVEFVRQGSSEVFQFLLIKNENVYRLLRIEAMSQTYPEVEEYTEPE